MKIRKRVIGMIMGITIVFAVGCNKTELADEKIEENVECLIERNLEEYLPQYNNLNEYQQTDLDYTKGIRNIDVNVEELDNKYEIKLILDVDCEDEYEGKFKNEYIMAVDKDDFKEMDLKDIDLLYDDRIEVVEMNTSSKYLYVDKNDLKNGLLLFLGDISKETMVGDWAY